ncbi:MAG: hypothetical protein KDK07_22075 [Bauldia sp.]|nr:hypothetical protein [Bauldia sp.]
MLRDMLPSIFQLATGLGFIIFLVTALMAPGARAQAWGRLFLFGLLLVPLGFLLMSRGTAGSSLGSAAPMLVAGAVALVASAVLVAIGVFVVARSNTSGGSAA